MLMRSITHSFRLTLGIVLALVLSAHFAIAGAASDTLVVGVGSEPGTLDPCFGSSIALSLYETPVGFRTEPSGDYAIQVVDDAAGWKPLLAEKVDVAEDGRTYTFHLRQGVRFYPSGNEMTADDWLFSWQRQLSKPVIGYCEFENQEASITDIASVEVIDRYTVRITTDEINPRALPFLRFQQFAILDRATVEQHTTPEDPWATEWLSQNTAGTGPYYIRSHTPGNELVLEANPYHWDEPPHFERVIMKIIPDVTTRLALLQRGDLDIAVGVPPHLAERVASNPAIRLVSVPSSTRVYAAFNPQVEPFGSKALRQAIAYAVPYDDIVDHLYGGRARRYDSFVLPGVPGYSGAGFDYDLDLDKAREKLAEAGIEPGLRIPLYVDSSVPGHQDIALLIQDQLSRIGVRLDVRVTPPAEFTARRHEEQLGFFLHETISWIDDPSTIVGLWMESDARGNRTQFADAEVDRLQAEWQFAPYGPERDAAYERIQQIFNESMRVIYLVLPHHTLLTRHDILGYALYKDGNIRFNELYREGR